MNRMTRSGTTPQWYRRPLLLELDTPHAEVGLGARAQVRGPVGTVELEDDALALAQVPEDRALQGAGGQGVLRAVGVSHHDAFSGPRVVRLDDALHGPFRRLGAYHAALRPPKYVGGRGERRIRLPGPAPPGPARAPGRAGRGGRRYRRARGRAAVVHRRRHR